MIAGDESRAFVRRGNKLMCITSFLFLVSHLIEAVPVLEQPVESVLPKLEPLQTVLRYTSCMRTVTWLGAFGGDTPKPLQLMHTHSHYRWLRTGRPEMQGRRLATRLPGNRYRGNVDALRASSGYPLRFGQAVASLTYDRLLRLEDRSRPPGAPIY